jgi:hypothetical protein
MAYIVLIASLTSLRNLLQCIYRHKKRDKMKMNFLFIGIKRIIERIATHPSIIIFNVL